MAEAIWRTAVAAAQAYQRQDREECCKSENRESWHLVTENVPTQGEKRERMKSKRCGWCRLSVCLQVFGTMCKIMTI